MKKILLFCLFASLAYCENLYNVRAVNEEQKKILFQLFDSGAYDFLSLSKIPGHLDRVIVRTSDSEKFETYLESQGIEFTLFKETIAPPQIITGDNKFNYKNFFDSQIIYDSIETMSEVINSNKSSPIRTKTWNYGFTYNGKPLYAIRIGLKTNEEETIPVILGDAGIHGNEWIGPPSAHKIIENLLFNKTGLKILEKCDVIFTACVNRDGYDISLKSSFFSIFGRKNQMPSALKDCAIEKNVGTNINRNFDWHFDIFQGTEDPCNYNYRGDYPFSAPETAALARLMKTPNVKFYYTVHSYGNLLLYPYGNSNETVEHFDEMRAVALEGQRILERQFGQRYIVGNTFEVLYRTTGASKDYAAGVAKIPISLIHEIGGEPVDFQPRLENIPIYTDMAWCSFEAMSLKTIEVLKL